jgi:PKD domain/Secretion system C-terminal sorting domain
MKNTAHSTQHTAHSTQHIAHSTKLVFNFLLFFLFTSSLFAQTPSGIAFSWDVSVGCQTFSQHEDHGEGVKNPIFLEDIVDGKCIRVCEGSNVTYTLSGNMGTSPNTIWNVSGGVISSQTPTTCVVHWGAFGSGNLSFIVNSPNGIVTKSICFEKIVKPTALFNVLPIVPGTRAIYSCIDQIIYFTNQSTANTGTSIVTYHWDFGDGTTSTAFEPNHAYTTDGVYWVTLWVGNACSCQSSYRRLINVREKGFNITCPSVVCDGETATYSLPFDGQNICAGNYNWSCIGGSTPSVDIHNGDATIVWNHVDATGFGYVTFNPSACDLLCLEQTTIKVPVIQTTGTIIGDTSLCVGQQAIYKLPQWPTTDFRWEIVENTTTSIVANVILSDQRNEVVIEPLHTGIITLRCVYQNTMLHCGGSATLVLNVTEPITFIGDMTTCQNTIGHYNTNGGVLTSWTLKDSTGAQMNTLANSSSYSYNFTLAGGYTLTVGGSATCPGQSGNITVVAQPAGPDAMLLVGDLIVCPNAPKTYTMPNDPTAQYHWSATNGAVIGSSVGNQVTISFTGVTPAQVVVYKETISPMSCNSLPTTIPVGIQQINAEISVANATVCGSSSASYQANASTTSTLYTEGETYTWSITPATLGSITTGQGTAGPVSVVWNNVTSITPATLSLVIHKCTLTPVPITKSIQINPKLSIGITSNNATVCSGSPVIFSVTSANGLPLDPLATVTWTFNGVTDTSNHGITVSHVFYNVSSVITNPNITAVITNPNGCGGVTNTANITVFVKPEPTATCSMSSSNGNVFCPPANPINSVFEAATAAGATLQWYYVNTAGTTTTIPSPAGQSSTINAINYGFGTYYFVATKGGCSSTSNFMYVIQNCAVVPTPCVLSPPQNAQNLASAGCPTIVPPAGCAFCDRLYLTGTTTGGLVPTSKSWLVIGPTTYNGPATTGLYISAKVGVYNTIFKATYTCSSGLSTTVVDEKNVTIPYLADFNYTVTCNSNSGFTLDVLDKSSFLSTVNASTVTYKYYYKLAAATTWPTTPFATTSNGTLSPLPSGLPSGNYNIKLVIQGENLGVLYPPCEKIINMTIATVPTQNITIFPYFCNDSAVNFGVTGALITDSFLWTFEPGTPNEATNTMATPSRVFSSAGVKIVTVRITNKYGCYRDLSTTTDVSLTTTVNIPAKCFNGDVVSLPNPPTVCAGGAVTLQYVPNGAECTPTQYLWMNGLDPVAGAANTASLTVTTAGSYWVKVKKGQCNYDTPSRIMPLFKPLPSIKLVGPSSSCKNGAVNIAAFSDVTGLTWSIDGVPNPAFTNLSTASITGLSVGTHNIVVTASAPSPVPCSDSATQQVTIVDAPDVPVITQQVFCSQDDPLHPYYHVILTATSNVAGVFNWSNGANGATTTLTDGGPIQVQVTNGGCTAESQTDVPKNPEDFMWIFPSGCYNVCDNTRSGDVPTLIGPRLPLPYWGWQLDADTIQFGNNTFPLPQDLTVSGTYNLEINTGSCSLVSNPLNVTLTACDKCILVTGVNDIKPTNDKFCAFTATISIITAVAMPVTLSVPNNELVIVPSSFTINPVTGLYSFTIIPIGTFAGGTVHILLTGILPEGQKCVYDFTMNVPSCIGTTTTKTNLLLHDIAGMSVTILPNPAKEQTVIDYKGLNANATIELYDITGRNITNYTTTANEGSWILQTNTYPAGIYIVVVRSNNIIVTQRKLIIQ